MLACHWSQLHTSEGTEMLSVVNQVELLSTRTYVRAGDKASNPIPFRKIAFLNFN